MLKNFITSALRNFYKHRLYTTINVGGLVCGITVATIVYLYVTHELRFDQDFKESDRLYRLLREANLNGSDYLIGVTSGPFAEAMQTDFPQEVEKTLRISSEGEWIRHEEKVFFERDICLADSNFFDLFPYELTLGDKRTALSLPNNIVITEEIALKYFGSENPIGKILHIADTVDLVVMGIIDTKSTPTHIKFDILGNIQLLYALPWFMDWWNNGLQTYVVLKEGVNASSVNEQLPGFMDKYFGKDFASNKNRMGLVLQPLGEIYFGNEVRYDWVLHGNKDTIYIFSGVAIFILLIALINFVNLSTAKSINRAKEVSVKKTLGSTRAQLIGQFLLEASLLSLTAIALSLMLTEITVPLLNTKLGTQLNLTLSLPFFASVLIFFLVISVLAGLYPSMVLSGFKPAYVLKSQAKNSKEGALFRKSLVVVQFGISAFLILVTIMVGRQLKYLNNKSLGFEKENVLLIRVNNNDIYYQRDSFKDRLLGIPGVEKVSKIVGEPGGFHDTMTITAEGVDHNPRMRTAFVDEDYTETFGILLAAGRDFSIEHPSDLVHAIMLNEAGAREIGWTAEEAIGKRIRINMRDTIYREVIGVLSDFHFSSLKSAIEPMVVSPTSRWVGQFAVRIKSSDYQQTLKGIEKAWAALVPKYPFSYDFLDERLNGLYRSEQLQSKLFTLFSSISIFIACLGIIGLATFTAAQRNREIGIRKVLGASVGQLSIMVMSEFLVLVLAASVLACPIGWWVIQQWLSAFAYKTHITLSLFLVVPLVTLTIAILCVAYQAFRVATNNPATVLKEE